MLHYRTELSYQEISDAGPDLQAFGGFLKIGNLGAKENVWELRRGLRRRKSLQSRVYAPDCSFIGLGDGASLNNATKSYPKPCTGGLLNILT